MAHLLLVPQGALVRAVELAVLAGEILVVQMKPVIILQLSQQHLFIPQGGVRNLGIGQGQGDRIIPRFLVGRRVYGYGRSFLQKHHLHIVLLDLLVDRGRLGEVDHVEGHAPQSADIRQLLPIVGHE
jgi:hypothetical protein